MKAQPRRAFPGGRRLVVFFVSCVFLGFLYQWLEGSAVLARMPWLDKVPLLLMLFNVMWLVGQQWRRRTQDPLGLRAMAWPEFQALLCKALERQGFHVTESGNRPGLVDLVLRKNRQTYLVHAKSWRTGKLGVDDVRELYAAMVIRGAPTGMVICCGGFGRAAVQFARETQIMLVDGPILQQWFSKVSSSTGPASVSVVEDTAPSVSVRPESMDTQTLSEFSSVMDPPSPSMPDCPLCHAPMRPRTARKGRHAGRKFWGCTQHPRCKGVRRWSDA